MDKEIMKAWARYTRVVVEINWCMREQGFIYAKMSYTEIDDAFEMQDKIVKDYFAVSVNQEEVKE